METIEIIGWILLGFLPTFAMLEVTSHKLVPKRREYKIGAVIDKGVIAE